MVSPETSKGRKLRSMATDNLVYPMRNPARKEYADLVESTMDAVIALIRSGSSQHPREWDMAVKNLALKTFREAHQVVEEILKDRSAAVEREHLPRSLPNLKTQPRSTSD
jgi:hypothetical protein